MFVCTRAQTILERLDAGEVVIGDGGFVFALEKRGYVKAGPWTPEAAAEHPEAGKTDPPPQKKKRRKKTPTHPHLLASMQYSRANATRFALLQCASCTASS